MIVFFIISVLLLEYEDFVDGDFNKNKVVCSVTRVYWISCSFLVFPLRLLYLIANVINLTSSWRFENITLLL